MTGGAVVADYKDLLKEQLRELCAQRSLPVSGTNDELIARLSGWDQAQAGEQDLLEAAGIEPGPQAAPVSTPGRPTVTTPVDPIRGPAPEPGETRANQTVHRQRYECPDDLTTESHEQWLQATESAAIGQGNRLKGGAHRVGCEHESGKRYAVYEVTLGGKIQAAG